MKRFAFAAVILFGAILILRSFVVISAGERGVVLTWGAISGDVMKEGLHFRIPFAQRIEKINVATRKLESTNSQAYSKDLQVVTIHSALNWNADPTAANEIYRDLRGGSDVLESKIVGPNLEVAIKQIVAKYTAEELLVYRQKIQGEIYDTVKATVAPNHAIVTNYAMIDESFSDAYEQAIERKQIAEQDALTAKNKLEQVKFEADQRVAQAEAEAKAIKIQAEAIQQQGGENYVQLKAVEKWNGVLPTYSTAGAPLPFLNVVK